MEKVKIRFCGGCNPRYDRTAFAGKIRAEFPDFEYVANADEADLVINLCGCLARCIHQKEENTLTVFNLTEWSTVEDFITRKTQGE